MGAGLMELGEIMLSLAQRRLENISQNIANLTTPGFRSGLSFQSALVDETARRDALSIRPDLSQGALSATGRELDLGVAGAGFFRLRADEDVYYTRDGQFARLADGRVATPQGLILQTVDGADLVLSGERAGILEDGTVLEGGAPVARIALFAPEDESALNSLGGTLLTADVNAMRLVSEPLIRQGMLEGANVDLAGEMMAMMAALRQAEVGARAVQTYDTLIGASISTFGRGGR